MKSIKRLSDLLRTIEDGVSELCSSVNIRYSDRRNSFIVIVAPDFGWEERTSTQKHKEIDLARLYSQLCELIRVLMRGAPQKLLDELREADKNFRTWLEFSDNWQLSADRASNERALRKSTEGLRAILAVLGAGPEGNLILIPDTNS